MENERPVDQLARLLILVIKGSLWVLAAMIVIVVLSEVLPDVPRP